MLAQQGVCTGANAGAAGGGIVLRAMPLFARQWRRGLLRPLACTGADVGAGSDSIGLEAVLSYLRSPGPDRPVSDRFPSVAQARGTLDISRREVRLGQ